MAQDEYKFISVDEEDDDIVIQAGYVDSADEASCDVVPEASAEPEEVPAEPTDELEQLLADASDEDYAAYMRHLRAKQRRVENTLATTQDDLGAKGPFFNMQRIIVIAAVLAIIVFIVYYVITSGAH